MSEIFERKKIPRISPREAGRIVGALAEIAAYEGRHRDGEVEKILDLLRLEANHELFLYGLHSESQGRGSLWCKEQTRDALADIHARANESADTYGATALRDMATAAAEGLAKDDCDETPS